MDNAKIFHNPSKEGYGIWDYTVDIYDSESVVELTGKTWLPDTNMDNYPRDYWECFRAPGDMSMLIVFEDGTSRSFDTFKDFDRARLDNAMPKWMFDYAWEYGHLFYKPSDGTHYCP